MTVEAAEVIGDRERRNRDPRALRCSARDTAAPRQPVSGRSRADSAVFRAQNRHETVPSPTPTTYTVTMPFFVPYLKLIEPIEDSRRTHRLLALPRTDRTFTSSSSGVLPRRTALRRRERAHIGRRRRRPSPISGSGMTRPNTVHGRSTKAWPAGHTHYRVASYTPPTAIRATDSPCTLPSSASSQGLTGAYSFGPRHAQTRGCGSRGRSVLYSPRRLYG
jgi:hypothetical protein